MIGVDLSYVHAIFPPTCKGAEFEFPNFPPLLGGALQLSIVRQPQERHLSHVEEE